MSVSEYLSGLFSLEGQTAVVIGGGGALGLCLETGLGKAGAKIVVADVRRAQCDDAVDKLQAAGIEAVGLEVNSADKNSLIALRDAAIRWGGGKVDMLVNCAGINAGTSFLDVDADVWDKIMAVNLKGTMLACQVFIEKMLETGGGSILNIGSVNSDKPLSRVFAYAASKAGVINLTANIAQEFATQGVRCNAICPGFFPAEQNRKLLDEKRVENIMNGTPMKRYGDPNELVATAILLLSKNAASYITGASFYVDGGFTCSWF